MKINPRFAPVGARSAPPFALALALGVSCTTSGGDPNGTGGSGSSGATGSSSGVAASGSSSGGVSGSSGGSAGSSGAASSGSGASTGTSDAGSSGSTSGGSTSGSGSNGGSDAGDAGSSCPSNATFCSGFETAGLPAGAVYMVNAAPGDWSRDFAIDTSAHHSGSSSLLVKNQNASGSSGSAYRMLAVPGTPNAFWVRFWIESDMPIGGVSHNAFAGGSIGDTPNDPMIELAEDVGVAFNTADSDQWPTGYGRLPNGSTAPYTLPAMTWECVEIAYDGAGRKQQLFINNVQVIDATGYPASTEALTYFKFGFDAYHGPPRQVWYDDVAVAPTRIGGCPTVAKSNM